jgi:hypothetical protein
MAEVATEFRNKSLGVYGVDLGHGADMPGRLDEVMKVLVAEGLKGKAASKVAFAAGACFGDELCRQFGGKWGYDPKDTTGPVVTGIGKRQQVAVMAVAEVALMKLGAALPVEAPREKVYRGLIQHSANGFGAFASYYETPVKEIEAGESDKKPRG